jgi:fermentation-respiration switch protein FrsA (DUF1100 family)
MIIALLVLLVVALLLLAAGYAAFYFAVVRIPVRPDPRLSKALAPFQEDIRSGAHWFRAQNPQRVELSSYDGLRLVGYFLPAAAPKGTLLLVHGYRSSPYADFGVIYPFYHSLGWNILTVCQRAHGESEGKYICYGVKERYDVRDWALYLLDRFGPEHPVVLDGISMGCASVLMALGTALPENVKGVVADCGFTRPYDEFVHVLKTRFHLPVHPILDIAQWFSKGFAGFGFRDCSTQEALQHSTLPVLFVHGEQDNFVPHRFSEENFAACRGRKKFISVEKAGHGTSYLFEMERCQRELKEFLDSCVEA